MIFLSVFFFFIPLISFLAQPHTHENISPIHWFPCNLVGMAKKQKVFVESKVQLAAEITKESSFIDKVDVAV